jgi:hypothetical protein
MMDAVFFVAQPVPMSQTRMNAMPSLDFHFPAIHRTVALDSPKVLRWAVALRFWTNYR